MPRADDAGRSRSPSLLFRCGVFLLALGFGWTVNELNLRYIRAHNPADLPINSKSTVYGYTVWSIDNAWYLPQVRHFLEGRGFTSDPDDPRRAVRRSPVYPLFYGVHYLLFGERYSFFVIRYTQLALNALAAVLLGLTVLAFADGARVAQVTMALSALNPYTAIYCYYTITEGLHPALAVGSLYCFSRARQGGAAAGLLAGFSTGVLALTRPVSGLLLPLYLLVLAIESRRAASPLRAAGRGGLLLLGFLVPVVPWTVRNYVVTGGEVVFLEKYYGEDPMGYGKAEIAFRGWWSCWDNPRAEEFANAVLEAGSASRPEEAVAHAEQFVAGLPAVSLAGTSRAELRRAVLDLTSCLLSRTGPLGACDLAVAGEFDQLTARFRKAAPVRYWCGTPLKNLASLVFQSFSAAYASLNPEGRRFGAVQVAVKGAMYVLNAALWLSVPIFCLFTTASRSLKLLSLLFPLSLLVFFLLVIRYMEARYFLQAYALYYVALAHLLVQGGPAALARVPASPA